MSSHENNEVLQLIDCLCVNATIRNTVLSRISSVSHMHMSHPPAYTFSIIVRVADDWCVLVCIYIFNEAGSIFRYAGKCYADITFVAWVELKTRKYQNISTQGIYLWYKAFDVWAVCQIRKIADAHALETFSPPPQVSDPDMHHRTCLMHAGIAN